ncbi:uncharacterized protein LOC134805446 [Cydia splendana]|uniref:uncharacterized protein LOC134805446 n=1 Tax=Cydia splendana TaxID=1100963 RepID=UPI00300D417C
MLATALVDVASKCGQPQMCRAFIDPGSEISFVAARVVEMLNLKKTTISGVVSGIEEGSVCIKNKVELQISSRPSKHASFHVIRQVEEDNNLLKKFWEVETQGYTNMKGWPKEEELCEEIYKTTTTRDDTGRYIVHLPLKESVEDTVKSCGETKQQATLRFKQLERKFEKNDHLKKEYAKVIHEYLELGHMKRTKVEDDAAAVYLPHHAVVKETRDTTKVRVVFDASAKGSRGISLNSAMMIGPTLQPGLRSLVIRWRAHRICVIGDIVKMYRQVWMTDEHTDLQRIVWRDTPSEKIESYKLLTVTFGTAAAPYLAVRTLNQLADDEAHT